MLAPRKRERIDDAIEAQRRVAGARELGVEEADVEARIVNDERGVPHELKNASDMLGEAAAYRRGRHRKGHALSRLPATSGARG